MVVLLFLVYPFFARLGEFRLDLADQPFSVMIKGRLIAAGDGDLLMALDFFRSLSLSKGANIQRPVSLLRVDVPDKHVAIVALFYSGYALPRVIDVMIKGFLLGEDT